MWITSKEGATYRDAPKVSSSVGLECTNGAWSGFIVVNASSVSADLFRIVKVLQIKGTDMKKLLDDRMRDIKKWDEFKVEVKGNLSI